MRATVDNTAADDSQPDKEIHRRNSVDQAGADDRKCVISTRSGSATVSKVVDSLAKRLTGLNRR